MHKISPVLLAIAMLATPAAAAPFETGPYFGAALGFGAGAATGAGGTGTAMCSDDGDLYPLFGTGTVNLVTYGSAGDGGYAIFSGTGLSLYDDGDALTSGEETFQPVTSADGLAAALADADSDTRCLVLNPGRASTYAQGFGEDNPPADTLAILDEDGFYHSTGDVYGGVLTAPATPSSSVGIAGLTGSAFAGYDWRLNDLLLVGVEGDATLSGIAGGATGSRTGTSALLSLRGRAGVTFDKTLAYLTAGLVVADVWAESGGSASSGLAGGVTAGIGTQYALTDTTTLRVEERFVSLQPVTLNGAPVTQNFAQTLMGFTQHF